MTLQPGPDWIRIATVDAHVAGEPLRVIVDGFPEPPGDTILEKRRACREQLDHLRRALILEPRGHADMYACLPVSPVTPDGDLGVLFLHNEGYSTMCGHGIIGVVKVAIECGLIEPRPIVRIDTPAGRVTARPELVGDSVHSVTFENVPSFLTARDVALETPELGTLRCDVAYGGAFYAIVDAATIGQPILPERFRALIDAGMAIKHAVASRESLVHHPDGDPDLDFLYGTILVERATDPVHSRNVCIFADGEVDRSPTGTGVSARVAQLHARNQLPVGKSITIESLIGTTFDVQAARMTEVGKLPAVIPVVTGRAYITGRHEFLIDPSDPLPDGFLLR